MGRFLVAGVDLLFLINGTFSSDFSSSLSSLIISISSSSLSSCFSEHDATGRGHIFSQKYLVKFDILTAARFIRMPST